MSIRAFKKIPTNNKEVDKLQSNIEQFVTPIISSQIIDGILLKDIILQGSTTNEVSHKLGRKLLGWIIIRKRANSTIWDEQDTNKSPSKNLLLNCSNTVTVDIWVF